MRSQLQLLIGMLFALPIQAQLTLAGKVTDSHHQPLAFVSVVIQHDSSVVSGTITDEKGVFQLTCSCEQSRSYRISFSLIGYKKITRPFLYPDTTWTVPIVLLKEKNVLNEVTVTGKKPLLERKADRFVINVENSFLANGNSGLEVLQKSPGIWVDLNGAIRIKGNQRVTVMINDLVQRMSPEELAEYLKTLRSEDISRIEVISNPPAEYEASGSGGIIHIILKKARKNGFNGSATARHWQQGKRPYRSMGLSFNARISNLYLYGGVSYSKDTRYIFETTDMTYPDNNRYYNYTNREDTITRQQYRLGLVYDLGKKQTIGIEALTTDIQFVQPFISYINYTTPVQPVTGTGYTNRRRHNNFGNTTFNYSWKPDTTGTVFKIIADYSYSGRTDNIDFAEAYSDTLKNSLYRNYSPFASHVYSTQADFIKVLAKKWTIKTGAKYTTMKMDNELIRQDYVYSNEAYDTTINNRYIYRESLAMFYGVVEKKIKNTTIKGGIRAEQTWQHGNSATAGQLFSRKYFGLFPSLFITRTFNEQKSNSTYISYSRRIHRPALHQLNPNRVAFNSYTGATGNPHLQPEYTHNIEAGYNFSGDYAVSVYMALTNHFFELQATQGSNTLEYVIQNFGTRTGVGCNGYAIIKINKVWSMNNSFSVDHLSYRMSGYTVNRTGFSVKSVHTFSLKNIMDIETGANYQSPYTYANFRVPQMFGLDIGFSKKIWKNKGTVKLYFSDIFNTQYEKETTEQDQTTIIFYRKRPTRTASLSFTYNFSSRKKISNRKIEQGSSEDRNRIGS